jgi:hypothetical protein
MTLSLSIIEAVKLATFAQETRVHHYKWRQDAAFPPPVFTTTTNIRLAEKSFLPQQQQQQGLAFTHTSSLVTHYFSFAIAAILTNLSLRIPS